MGQYRETLTLALKKYNFDSIGFAVDVKLNRFPKGGVMCICTYSNTVPLFQVSDMDVLSTVKFVLK